MLICILSLSINVFILAFSAMLLPKYVKEKDAEFLSNRYYTITFQGDNPSVEEVKKITDNKYEYFIVNFAWSQSKAVEFSEKQMDAIGLNVEDGYKKNENIAVVNKDYQKICYEVNNEAYTMLLGNEYKVQEYFEDKKDDITKVTRCYVNLNSQKIMQNKEFDCIFLDLPETSEQDIVNELKNTFKNIKISKWSGSRFQEYYTRSYMVGIIILCGAVIFLNCIIFVKTWVEKQQKELNIRIKIGATKRKNGKLLCGRIFVVYFINIFCGILLSKLEMGILNKIPWLRATRELLGTKIYAEPILISVIMVFLIAVSIVRLQYKSFNRREQNKNV